MNTELSITRRKIGRPPQPIPAALAEDMLVWLSQGKPLREWCCQPGKAHFTSVYDWISKDASFALRVRAAREAGYDVIADECLTIADTEPSDSVAVQWQRLRIDTRLKLLAKWNPRKYGDRVGLDHTGGVAIRVITGVPDRELAQESVSQGSSRYAAL